MKILIVRTYPDIIQSNSYNVQEIGLAKALTRKKQECGIVFYNGNQPDTTEKIMVECEDGERAVTIYRLKGFKILKNGFFPSLNKIVKEYDVIQVHEYDQITSWLYYAWSHKKTVIYHGPYYDSFNKGYNLKCKVFDNVFLRIRHNKTVPCMTKSVKAAEFLLSKGFTDVTAVGVGLDVENFEKEPEAELSIGIEKDVFTIVYVGKIEERRNSLFLVEIFQKVTELYDNIRCVVIGNGEEEYRERFLQQIDPMVKSGKVRYYVSATQSQLADLYKNASLMVFPTNYDIFGMVLAEAVYFGLPVITTPNGGADMLITDEKRGLVVQGFVLNDWVGAIEKYYNRIGNGMNGIPDENERKQLLWDSISEKMLDAYRK